MMHDAVVVALAISIGSFLKGITGLGLPLIAIPLMATFIGVHDAVIIMAIPTMVTNVALLRGNRDARSAATYVRPLLVTGLVGAVTGTVLLTSVDERLLSLALGGLIVAFLLVTLASPGFSIRPAAARYASPPIGLAAGLLQGAMGTSGVVLATYLHGFRMQRDAYVYSITALFQAFAAVQIFSLVALGRYDGRSLALSLVALPSSLVLLAIGMRLSARLSVTTFRRLTLIVLAAAAVKLIFDGITAS